MYHCHLANPAASVSDNLPPRNIQDLCSVRCPCAQEQGGCSNSQQCQGDLFCARNYGMYKHRNQALAVPGLNSCLPRSMSGDYAEVGDVTKPPVTKPATTKAPTVSPKPATTKAPTVSPNTAPTKFTGTAATAAPTKAVTAAPTSTITDATICQCDGGTGKYETCAKWGYNHPLCLLAYGGDIENPPPCKPTPGGKFLYSSSFNSWYMYGCTPQNQVTGTTSTANNTTDTAIDAAAAPVSSNDALLAGSIGAVAGCFVGVVAVALVVVKRAQKSKAVPSSLKGADGKVVMSQQFAAGGVSSNNPSFAGEVRIV
jgi:hypothetical protein